MDKRKEDTTVMARCTVEHGASESVAVHVSEAEMHVCNHLVRVQVLEIFSLESVSSL